MLLLDKIDSTIAVFPEVLLLLADLYQMNGLFEVSEQKLLTAKNFCLMKQLLILLSVSCTEN